MSRPDDEPRFGERIESRPAPRYGEYAPPGWVSPVPPPEVDEQSPTESPLSAPPPTGSPVPGPVPTRAARPSFGRFATFLLLGIGFFSALQSLIAIPDFASSMLQQFTRFGYHVEGFQGQAALQNVGTVSAVVNFVVFLLVATWSLRRLRAGKNSWVPLLVAGVVMNLLSSCALVVVLATDPAFLASL